jgi:hypothetical protein
MARTDAGRQLTEGHRRRQLAIRSRALQEFLVLTRLWDVADPQSFNRLVEASIPFVQARHGTSAAEAARYFEAFHLAEAQTGAPTVVLPEPPARDKIAASLYATGQAQARRALQSGLGVAAVRANTLVTMSGAVTRNVLDGGRQTLINSTERGERLIGWMRITGPKPCAFCAMLASRGPVYTSGSAAVRVGRTGSDPNATGRVRGTRARDESFHDNCVCTAEPITRDAPSWREQYPDAAQYDRLWRKAQAEAEAAGDLQRGTSNDALNAFRRAMGDQLTPVA